MSNEDNSPLAGFGKFVPGFDFLQNLATQAASSASQKIPQMPNLGNWVAPTLNVEELDRRIDELKAVQFWLDQNATALKATIQALEVQKMTLATLKGMNFNMGDVANAFKLKVADSVAGGVQKVADKAKTFPGLEIPGSSFLGTKAAQPADNNDSEDHDGDDTDNADDEPAEEAPQGRSKSAKAGKAGKDASAGGVIDPMQWWGALTQQFQTIAADAMKEAAKNAAVDTTKNVAAGLAKDAIKNATGLAKGMAESAQKTIASGANSAMNTALRNSQGWPTTGTGKAAAKPAGKTAANAKPRSKPAATSRSTAKTGAKTASKTKAKTTAKAPARKSR